MAFQKFRGDQLFDGSRMLEDQHVLITSESGTVEEIVHLDEAGDDIRVFPGILCPGFINCHCHLELSHMKGSIPEGTGLIEFVTRVIKDRHYSDDQISGGALGAKQRALQLYFARAVSESDGAAGQSCLR